MAIWCPFQLVQVKHVIIVSMTCYYFDLGFGIPGIFFSVIAPQYFPTYYFAMSSRMISLHPAYNMSATYPLTLCCLDIHCWQFRSGRRQKPKPGSSVKRSVVTITLRWTGVWWIPIYFPPGISDIVVGRWANWLRKKLSIIS